jgi:peptidoglycan/xylan/chitin deacetylase (PgdA/CDA1 family)
MKYSLFRAGFRVIAATHADRWLRSLAQGCGLILTFHHVRPHKARPFTPNALLEITPEFLEFVLYELRDNGFELIPLDAVPDRLDRGACGRPFAVLTFDDGYRDNIEHAWPILKRHGAPWSVFVTTDFAEGLGRLWWIELEQAIARLDRLVLFLEGRRVELPTHAPHEKQRAFEKLFRELRAGPQETLYAATADLAAQADLCTQELVRALCLSWDELRSLVREPDVTIGGHTRTHSILTKRSATAAGHEMSDGKTILEQHLARPVRHFAYPGGDSTCAGPREFRLAQEAGFVTAVTTRPGHLFLQHKRQLHALPRVSVNGLFQTQTALRALLSGVPFLAWNRAHMAPVEGK